MKKILFVCLGNICRSPSAEAVMKKLVNDAGLESEIQLDSAGTSAYHAGETPDGRMTEAAARRGIHLAGRSRKVVPKRDFAEFDYIVGMDNDNIRALNSMAPDADAKQKIHLMTDFCSKANPGKVPDPYYGGANGFEVVLDVLEDACSGLLAEVKKG